MAVIAGERSRRSVRKRVALGAALVGILVGLATLAAKAGDGPETAMRESVNKATNKTTTTLPPKRTTTVPTTAMPPPVTVTRTTEPEPEPPAPEPEPAPAPAPAPTPRGARPDETNTGPTVDESALRRVTAAQLEAEMTPGAVIENVYVTGGDIDVKAPNVTLRNFVIDAGNSSRYGIMSCGADGDCGSRDWPGGFVAEDGIIRNTTSAVFWGGGVTFRRVETYGHAKDAFKPLDDVTIEGVYSHHAWGTAADAHADWVQFQGEAHNVVIRGNNCDMRKSLATGGQHVNACIQVNKEISSLDVLVENNWMEGGNYTANCSGPAVGGIRFVNNVFGRDVNFGVTGGCSNWSGNTYTDGSPA